MATVPLIPTQHSVCEKIHDIWFYDTVAAIDFQPEVYVDVTDFWDTKAKMLSCHESQNAWLEHMYGLTLVDNAKAQSRLRGFQTGCLHAECFRRARVFPQSVAKEGLLG